MWPAMTFPYQFVKGFVSKIDKKNVFNIDPIRILYFMKEHMRTIDMLLKFDKDNSNTLSREELHNAFVVSPYKLLLTDLCIRHSSA